MAAGYAADMDPLIAANRLPKLAEMAMRNSVLAAMARARMTPRVLVDDALIRFERAVGRYASGGVRPALLFAERDRVVKELRAFIDGRLSLRLAALQRRDVVALGRGAAPFDAIVRGRRGACYGVLLRRLPKDGRRLEALRRIRTDSNKQTRTPVAGILVYDFTTGVVRVLLDDPGAQRMYRDLRAS